MAYETQHLFSLITSACRLVRYGDMHTATQIYKAVVNAARGEPVPPLALRWGETKEEASVFSFFSRCAASEHPPPATPTFAEAAFDSPAAAYLPEESKEGRLLFVWRTGDDPPDKIAVHLPTTGDQFYFYRKQIALELLKNDIASVILMFPYYAARKPPGQYAHVLPTVSAFITQVSAGVLESAAIASWCATKYPGTHTVFTGVSLGGSVANCAAIIAAAEAGPRGPGVGSCPVVATSSATSFLTGVLHSRIAWEALEASPAGAADDLNAVLASVGDGDAREEAAECKEGGEPLNATEQALADAMRCLSLPKLIGLMQVARKERGLSMPCLGAVVQVSAEDDRFVGRHSEELFGLLKGLSTSGAAGEGGETCERRDITGGHISTLFRIGEAIVPAIVATFEKLARGRSPPETTNG